MKHKRLRWFIVAVAIQLAILLGLAGRHLFTVITGTPVLLQTEAVDPWDLFRGDYVRLNFAISTLPLPSGQDRLNRLEKVWVVLQPPGAGEKYWTAKTVSRQRPAVKPGEVAVKAGVVYVTGGMVRLEYGFEQFFVPEGQGLDLEREHWRMDVEVAVDRFGRAILKTVYWDGLPIKWD